MLHLTQLAVLQTLLLVLHREHGRMHVSAPYCIGVPVKLCPKKILVFSADALAIAGSFDDYLVTGYDAALRRLCRYLIVTHE